jgi:cytoskeletal protein RodZ
VPIPSESFPELHNLGKTLAAARRQRGFDVDQLAERLRIGTSQLKALEAGDHAHLPEGVFVIALARRVASALEINIDNEVQDLRGSALMRRPKPQPPLAPVPPRPRAPGSSPTLRRETSGASNRTSPGPVPWILVLPLVLGGLGLAAALALNPWKQRSTARLPAPAAIQAPAPKPPLKRPAKAGTPASGSPALPSQPATASRLRLTSSEPSWIQVRQSDGKVIFEGTLSGEQSFPLGRGLEVLAGRPYAVRASLDAGPGRALGGVDDISWHRFSPNAPLPALAPAPGPTPNGQSPKTAAPEPATAAP